MVNQTICEVGCLMSSVSMVYNFLIFFFLKKVFKWKKNYD